MSRLIWSLGVLSLLCLARPAAAADPCPRSLGHELRCTRCATIPCCCPDDYCRKPIPCIPCLTFSPSPNGYCPKPAPCVPCICLPRCPDNYCPKPLPKFCWPTNCQSYRCPPGDDQVASCTPPRAPCQHK